MDDEIAEIVSKFGWFAANINDHEPPFVYSIGLMETYAHPELIVFGLDQDNAHALLSGLVDAIRNGQSYAEPGVYSVRIGGEEYQVGFRNVHPTQHPLYLGFAMGYCRRIEDWPELRAVQVFWPDGNGKFPFEVGCDLSVYQFQPRLDIGLTAEEIEEFEREWE